MTGVAVKDYAAEGDGLVVILQLSTALLKPLVAANAVERFRRKVLGLDDIGRCVMPSRYYSDDSVLLLEVKINAAGLVRYRGPNAQQERAQVLCAAVERIINETSAARS
ncbi:MAG TPA: hypothetical protein VD907_04335 [Verrucomicrobiae bacterium]|nr:hypothetical protein [Verrucomicrobiae bacterium]